jgi:hypothetical protein
MAAHAQQRPADLNTICIRSAPQKSYDSCRSAGAYSCRCVHWGGLLRQFRRAPRTSSTRRQESAQAMEDKLRRWLHDAGNRGCRVRSPDEYLHLPACRLIEVMKRLLTACCQAKSSRSPNSIELAVFLARSREWGRGPSGCVSAVSTIRGTASDRKSHRPDTRQHAVTVLTELGYDK